MTLFQAFVVVAGLGFLFGGIWFFKNSKKWGIIGLLIGILLIYNSLFGEVAKSQEKQRALKETGLAEIERILILPSKRRKNLIEDTLIMSGPEIRRIQECLSKTEETLRTNRNEEWGCILNIQKTSKANVLAGISKDGDQTILELYSRGEYGVNYGTMINNELGILLEEILKNREPADNTR